MSLVPFEDLIRDAELKGYALGYFETWDIQSLIGVIRAAEASSSPVIVGFSGVYLPELCHGEKRLLRIYGNAGRAAAEEARVPVAYVFNESPYLDWVYESMNCGFNLVMYSDDSLPHADIISRISTLVKRAHRLDIAVEAEVGKPLYTPRVEEAENSVTDPEEAAMFVNKTGVDAIGIVVGNRHLGSDEKIILDIELIKRLKKLVEVPLVLHAGSHVEDSSLREGIKAGIRKVNIGYAIKKPAFLSVQKRVHDTGKDYPGYEVLGTGRKTDVLGEVGSAIYYKVIEKLKIFGSAGRAR